MSKNYRRITDFLPRGVVKRALTLLSKAYKTIRSSELKKFLIIAFSLCALVFLLTLVFLVAVYKTIQQQREYLLKKASYWQRVTEKYPNFPDAFYETARYYFALGEKEKAFDFAEKALFLDPQFSAAQSLKKMLLE
jgi:tetratricopeptide (TPR) repeat protein